MNILDENIIDNRSFDTYIMSHLLIFLKTLFTDKQESLNETPFFVYYSETSPFITLIEKSTGLDYPSKEKGKTEYELADMNGNGYLDIVSVGDHGSPWFNSEQHGILTSWPFVCIICVQLGGDCFGSNNS